MPEYAICLLLGFILGAACGSLGCLDHRYWWSRQCRLCNKQPPTVHGRVCIACYSYLVHGNR